MIDGKIRHSQTFQKFTYRQRDLWHGLIEVADDQGRLPGNLPNVRSLVWPADDISLEDVDKDLSAIKKVGNIIRYEVDGCKYIQITNWQKYQSEAEWLGLSDYPHPNGWHDRARFHGKNHAIITLNWNEPIDDITYSTTFDKETGKKISLPYALPLSLPYIEPFNEGEGDVNGEVDGEGDVEALPESPNAYTVYTNNIGELTSFIADGIDNWLKTYPEEWIPAAIEEAVKNNARNFKYCDAILKRWKIEGFKSDSKPKKKSNGDTTQDIIARAQERYGMNGDNS